MPGILKNTKIAIKESIKDILRSRNLRICDYERATDALFKVRALEQLPSQISFLQHLPPETAMTLLSYLPYVRSQSGQDLFVLSQLGPKKDGFFVEFGVTDGVNISNSYFFETTLGWKGIVAEPAKMWHPDLFRNRKCNIEKRCVWSSTGATLQFKEAGELSTVSEFSDGDFHAASRQNSEAYDVQTISLNDLLDKYEAPAHVDYLSIDTEGSEFEILNAFDFGARTFGVITCEHNFAPQRETIHSLLVSHGYKRIMEAASKVDDWYVLDLD
jgi:FkbM family methyltransferase